MATKVIMPQLGESVVEGTVTKWLKAVGEKVNEFEPILELNTDKVDTEVPAPASGTVLKIYIGEGQTVRAGTLLGVIGEAGEAVPEEAAEPQPTSGRPKPTLAPAQPAPAAAAPMAKQDLGFISPVVARIAAENDVDLAQVRGTGQGGRITKKDVLAYLAASKAGPARPAWETPASGELFRPTEEVFGAKPAVPAAATAQGERPAPAQPETLQPLSIVRRSIAEHMIRSRHTSAHVTTVMEADLTRVVAHREVNKQAFSGDGANLTFTTYFVAASVAGLKAVPLVNASWSEAGIVLHRRVNIGVAVSLGEQGLIVPVIKDADQKSLLGLAKAINDLSARARSRQLRPDEVQEGTFTITNHGIAGSLFATPIINQPQCAILGVGAIQKRVVVVEGESGRADSIAIKPMVYLTLTFDHRILDGAIADAFLGRVVEALQRWA
jgi:2-oxoglutarate dehydrogenase E2 component (dihydrolipoamide succinyltransferase)